MPSILYLDPFDPPSVKKRQVKMMAPNKPGTVKLDVFVKSDSYVGLDQKQAVQFEVVCAANLPQYEPHPDDLELDNEPTLFEQVMQAYDDETDSEDEVRREDKMWRLFFGLLEKKTFRGYRSVFYSICSQGRSLLYVVFCCHFLSVLNQPAIICVVVLRCGMGMSQ